jgi:hypothetical protein
MSRRWVCYRFHELASAGQAIHTIRGQWRIAAATSSISTWSILAAGESRTNKYP